MPENRFVFSSDKAGPPALVTEPCEQALYQRAPCGRARSVPTPRPWPFMAEMASKVEPGSRGCSTKSPTGMVDPLALVLWLIRAHIRECAKYVGHLGASRVIGLHVDKADQVLLVDDQHGRPG
jgi:hypothetical protein